MPYPYDDEQDSDLATPADGGLDDPRKRGRVPFPQIATPPFLPGQNLPPSSFPQGQSLPQPQYGPAGQAAQDLRTQGPPPPPHPKLWQRLVAGGLGAMEGVGQQQRRPLNLNMGPAEDAVLGNTKYAQQTADYGRRLGVANQAAEAERKMQEDQQKAEEHSSTMDLNRTKARESDENTQSLIDARKDRTATAQAKLREGVDYRDPNETLSFPGGDLQNGPPPLPNFDSGNDAGPMLPPKPPNIQPSMPPSGANVGYSPQVSTMPPEGFKDIVPPPGSPKGMLASKATPQQVSIDAGRMVRITQDDVDNAAQYKVPAPGRPGDVKPKEVYDAWQANLRKRIETATAAKANSKDNFMGLMSKVAQEQGLNPAALTDPKVQVESIKRSQVLTEPEKAQAYTWLQANANPAATSSNIVLRNEGLQESRVYQVINKDTGQLEMRNAQEINGSKGLYAPAAPGAQAMGKTAIFSDIHYNIDTARKALQALDEFDPATRAKIAYYLRETHPESSIQTFLTGELGTTLTPQQAELAQALAQLSENAMSLRSVAGMGQGAQDLRDAIRSVIPSGKTPTKDYGLSQLNKFESVVSRIEKGVPGMGRAGSTQNITGEAKTYTQADVDAAVAAYTGTTPQQIEAANNAKGWKKVQ